MRMQKSQYKTLIYVSMLGTALGICREIFLLIVLGISKTNDNLQIYLSIAYNISLLGDAARLAVLNLLQKFQPREFIVHSFIFYFSLGLLIAITHFILNPGINIYLLLISTLVGCLNIFVVIFSVCIQYGGNTLIVQKVALLPNFILLPCLVVFNQFFKEEIVFLTIIAYLLIPISQINILKKYFFSTREVPKIKDLKYIYLQMLPHTPLTFATVIAQIAIRTSLFHLADGYLTIYNFFQKILDSLRVNFVETYIASKIKTWVSSKENYLEKKIIKLNIYFLLIVSIFILLEKNIIKSEIKLLLVMIIGFCLQMINRIAYVQMNSDFLQKKSMFILYSIIEIVFALLIYLLINRTEVIFYGYFLWFIVKNFLQILWIKSKRTEVSL